LRPPAYIDTSAASLAQAADVVFTRIARRVIQISRLRDNSARVGGSDKTAAARLSLVGDLWRSAIKNKLLLIIDKQLTFSYIKDPDCALHCSLAGGRKVMSFYSGYLFSLGGRQQDRLSHTLISPSQLEYAHFLSKMCPVSLRIFAPFVATKPISNTKKDPSRIFSLEFSIS
jgi:CRISPR-associated protein (TIGR02584 family)